MANTKIAIVDDQIEVRKALGELLDAYGYTSTLFESGDAFLEAAAKEEFACVISDVRMPGMDGVQLARELAGRQPAVPAILISGQADVPMAIAALKAGAEDFIEKPVDDIKLVAAINRGLSRVASLNASSRHAMESETRFDSLTAREKEVFDLVSEGQTSQVIAKKLGISSRTVESYRAQIMDKLQIDNIAALVRLAIRLGRITP
ncbi:response regulator [Roseiarcaceae bacterium H3SJ34-1]|uniref:response regulator transcription factor n=1 Tax=Terripilifer ovatus TaxID=3032367 RepID=UPI003AB968CD|nr:response regulator [Roseiarcaceae bacterium H3SJ34-1]